MIGLYLAVIMRGEVSAGLRKQDIEAAVTALAVPALFFGIAGLLQHLGLRKAGVHG